MFINTLLQITNNLYNSTRDFCREFDSEGQYTKLSHRLLQSAFEIDTKARHIYSGTCTQDVLITLSEICSLCDDCHYLVTLLTSKNHKSPYVLRMCTSTKRMCKKHMVTFRQMISDCEK